jgi:hypothetical protein
VVPRERCLPLVEVLGIALAEVRVLCPFGGVEDELPDGHTGVDLHRAGIHVAHLERDGPPESGIDPAPGLVERDAEPGDARFSLDGRDDVVGKPDAFKSLGKDELPGVEDKGLRVRLLHTRDNTVPVVRVDDLSAGFVPDKMVPEPDIERVGLHEFFVVGIDLDMAPFDAIEELPVYENHCLYTGC